MTTGGKRWRRYEISGHRDRLSASLPSYPVTPTTPEHVFDVDRFIEDCRAAVREDPSHKAAREVLAQANSDPAAILAALGEPARTGVTPLYKSDTLTILDVVWGRTTIA